MLPALEQMPVIPHPRLPQLDEPFRQRLGMPVALAAVYIAALPLLRPSGPVNSSPVDLVGVALLVGVVSAWLGRRLVVLLPYGIAVAVFALGGVLGALHGPVPGAGLTAVVQDLVLLVLCACIASVAQAGAARVLLVRVWAISGLCWGALLIVAYLTHVAALVGGGGRYGARATLTMGDPNMAANYLMVSLFMLYVARWPAGRYWRSLATLVMVGAVFLTGSNGALTAALVGLAVATTVSFCAARRLRTGIGLLALVGLVVVVLAAVPVARWQSQVTAAADASSVPIVRDSIGRQGQSSSTRHLLLDESIQLFRSDAVVGTGPGSTKPLLEANQAEYPKEAHDDYAAALVERGMLGLVGLVLLIAATVRRLGGLARRWAAGGYRLLPLGAMAGTAAAIATSGMFYEVLHFRQVWVFLGLLAGSVGDRRD